MTGATKRLIIRAAVAIVLVGGAVWFLASGDSSTDDSGGGGGESVGSDLDASCQSLHEGHAAMAWNPTSADEMVEAGCGWPYEPYLISTDGGEEDPAIDVEFEPRLYRDLASAVSATGLGFCSVTNLPEEAGDGYVFGFLYEAAEPGCPGLTATVEVVVREYVTRAHRDAAAGHLDDPGAIVLGRWILQVTGTDHARVDQITESLIEMGGLPMGDL